MKKLFTKSNPLYLITDTVVSGLSHAQMAKQAINTGVRTIQLREKNMTKKVLYSEAAAVRALTLRHGVILIINDYVDIALAVNADGVHLGQDDMPIKEARKLLGRNRIIGISTHSLKQAVDARRGGADYIGFGPIFQTVTKDAGTPKGINTLIQIRRHIKIPIAAIGGITSKNAAEVLRTGADAVAAASAVLSGNIKKNIKTFLSKCT